MGYQRRVIPRPFHRHGLEGWREQGQREPPGSMPQATHEFHRHAGDAIGHVHRGREPAEAIAQQIVAGEVAT